MISVKEAKHLISQSTQDFGTEEIPFIKSVGRILKEDIIVGVSGLWFCTRHYMGKSVELDHVFIKPSHRGNGLGKQFMKWIYDYAKNKGCKSVELNTYVQNYPSHKFYYNEGFEILGYHFLKKL